MDVKDGMYVTPAGDIFKVQTSKTTQKPYAKHLRPINGQRLLDATSERVQFEFVYAPGAINALRQTMALTLEQAQAFGIRYGVCCVCGKFLKDATSVEAGIGPRCGGRLRQKPDKYAAELAAAREN